MTQKPKNQADRSLKRQVEAMALKRLAGQDVVDLAEFRSFRKGQSQQTILVVDDEEIMRNALKRILESANYKVIVTEDAMGLTKHIEATPFDLILLDVELPWVSGLDLCKLLKEHHAIKGVPVVLISGRKSKEDIEKAFEAGCDDFVAKPFEVDVILDVVSKSLEKLEEAK